MKLSIVVIAVAFVAAAQGVSFNYSDCILVDVDGSLTISAKEENGTVVGPITAKLEEVPSSSINGTCSGTGNSASMTVQFGQSLEWRLLFTLDGSNNVLLEQAVVFTPSGLFNNSALPEDQVSVSDTGKTTLSPRNESYMCNAEQTIPFDAGTSGNVTFTVSQTISNLKVQAFDVKDGTYSEAVVDCAADENSTTTVPPSNTTTPEPTNTTTVEPTNSTTVEPTTETPTTTPAPSAGAYAVKGNNVTCIVVKGDITISNITYTKTDNSTATADDITVPAYNGTKGAVKVSGTCGNTTQQIVITFNGNWSLSMTFVKGGAKAQAMLGAEQDEYYVNDIALTYYLTSNFFPNASDPGSPVTVEHKNISGELWKAQVGGGSYKCDADITESLGDGVQIKTTNLQTKAFNTDNNENFDDDNVSECPADDESNSIVPIAVGAALAGLVVIVLIAYLIGRRRSRRQGYESV